MQNIKKTLKSKRFWLGTVLPFALAVAAAFVARYQLEISDAARCAPETAGALVAHTVEVILQERAATARSERGVS